MKKVVRKRAYKKPARQVPALPRIVLVDADVFFGARLRDIFIHMHEEDVLRVRWTAEIEDEWTRNVLKHPGVDQRGIRACVEGMRSAVPGWEVVDYKQYKAKFSAVRAKDQHVAAASYKLARDEDEAAVALVTKNVDDFPPRAFRGTGVTRFSAAEYLTKLYHESPHEVLRVFEICRAKLKKPELDKLGYIEVLRSHGCEVLATAVETQWQVTPKM